MKKPLLRIISTLCICCMMLLQCSAVRADETPSISKVIATYAETERDVLTQVLEVEAGVMADLNLEVVLDNSVSGLTYKVYQYNGSTKQKYELVSSGSNKFSIEAEKLKSDIPLYLAVYKNNTNIITKLLTVRVNPGRAQLMFPESYASTYTENIQVDMSELLPGMKFQMHPYVLPITCQAYTDGRIIIGMGINSSNVNFWKNARNGTLNEKTNVKELSDAFWGKSSNKSAVKGRDLGLVVEFSGWVQGNIYTTEPMKGELSVYIGSGFDVTGQYAILTWEVTVTIGVNGAFDFELRYTDKTGKYDDFHADSFAITFKTGLELYGGLGLSSIASVGLYGSGYIGVKDQFYPDPVVQSLVLAGECGFKVKAFSRTLFSFAIVSGSHDFVKKNLTADDGANSSFLGTSYIDSINSTLVSQNYANMSGAINEPDSNGTWYTGLTALTGSEGSLTEYETDPNFDHKIAENIYPDNRLQVVNTSKDARQMNIIFLGSDSSRTNGNRSRLMNFYFKEEDNYLSEPVWIFSINDYDYANTADYDPYVYHMEKSEKTGNIEKTYMVWRSSTKTFAENATFEEIAKNTDVFFTEYDPSSNTWSKPYRITEYAVRETSELFACGASVSAAKDGSPQITYYTSPVTDPAGIDETAERIVFFESFDGTYWNREDVCTVTGSITRVDSAYYKGNPCVAVSYSYMENGEKKYTVELWQRGDSWQKIYTFDGSMNALFTDCGNGTSLLTWYKDGRVYGMLDDQDFTRAITQEDIKVPSSDYRI